MEDIRKTNQAINNNIGQTSNYSKIMFNDVPFHKRIMFNDVPFCLGQVYRLSIYSWALSLLSLSVFFSVVLLKVRWEQIYSYNSVMPGTLYL